MIFQRFEKLQKCYLGNYIGLIEANSLEECDRRWFRYMGHRWLIIKYIKYTNGDRL